MKRIFNALGLMLAATLTLTNCTKNIETPVVESEGVPFEIVASTVETKTVNDGMSTLWAAGDQINLFHAVAGTTTYSNDNNFTVNNVETGLFKGTLTGTLAEDSAYDWYAFYPYTNKMTTPANTAAYAYIGNKNGLTQNGYDSMAHVSGTNCPLYGVAKAVPSGEMPSLQMHHLSSVIAVKVTNTLETPLKVNEVIFTAGDNNLTGSFYVNIAGDKATYKPRTDYVSTEAKVTVNNATELDEGESATVYIVIVPFEAYEGNKLELIVNGYKKEINLEKNVNFEAGKIKTLNFAYDSTEEPEGPEAITVKEFLDLKDTATEYVLTGKITRVANTTYGNFDLTDATGTVYVYGLLTPEGASQKQWAAADLKQGDIITVKGKYSTYNGSAQVKNAVYISHKGIAIDKTSLTFTAEGGSADVTATLVNSTDPISVSVDNPHFTVALKTGSTYTVTAPANETEEDVYANVTFTAGDLTAVVTVSQDAPVVSGEVPGGRDDFNTIKADQSYSSRTTTAGWKGTNCAVMQGGTTDSNPTFKFIGSTNATRAFTMNGKTTAKGKIVSPTLTTGCGKLSLKYGNAFSEANGVDFTVTIKQNGAAVKTYKVDVNSVTQKKAYTWEQDVNVAGDFVIEITNNSPSNNNSSNKDRVSIWDIEWIGYAE